MGKRAFAVTISAAALCAVFIVCELILPAFDGKPVVILGILLLAGVICALFAARSDRREADERQAGKPAEPPSEREELERIKSDFVTNVSHELRTPVTSIKGFAQTLMEPGMDENTRLRFLHIIDAETDRLKMLVDDILTLGDIENRQAPRERTDMGACAVHVYDVMKDSALKKGLNISLYADPGIYVEASGPHLEQLIINLVDNAIKYTEHGNVDVSVVRSGPYVDLTVADTGIGIPESEQSRVYERFYRVDRTRSRENGGTGLGLAIVKHIALLYGATLSLDSAPGRGSRFVVRFKAV